MSSTVTPEGQVTIPKALLERLGLAPGDDVSFELQPDNRIMLSKAQVMPKLDPEALGRRLEALRGIAGPGPTADETMAMLRGDD